MPVQVRQAAQALPQVAPPLEHHLEEAADAFHDALTEEDEGRVVPFATTELVEKASLKDYVLAAEKRHLLGVLKHCDSVNKACAVLQISRPTFYQKLKVHGISLSNKRLV
jgi:transcriptional regulator with PAS, ATPase and Fis domain